MKKELFLIFLVLFFLATPVFSLIHSSPLAQFNVTQDMIRLNWTNAYQDNITLNSSLVVTVELLNDTTLYPDSGLTHNYSYSNPTTICLRIPLFVRNSSSEYRNDFNLTTSDTNVTLVHTHTECYPGRYYTSKFTIRNTMQTNETANLTIYLDIPISTTNTLSNTTGVGSFSGTLPLNATGYQSFYFNATSSGIISSTIANATGVVINFTSSADTDIFLLDSSGITKARSVNKSSTNESLLYSFLPSSSEMWEIRLFGNSTSAITYNGNVIFTTLNSIAQSLDFGTMNATSNMTQTYTLRNEGNLSLSSVTESKDIYYVKRFNANSAQNFTAFAPDSSITNKIKVVLNWTGGSDYSFNLYNPSGSLMANSSQKHAFANISGVVQEEYNETTDVGSTTGNWIIEVLNSTAITDSYMVAVYLYTSATNWLATNYSTRTFNTSGQNNATIDVHVNLTIPSTAMNGTYEGYIKYLDNRNAGISIPVKVDVTTSMLVVNNTMNAGTYRVDEDYGANLTRKLFFNISNLGFGTMNLNFTDSQNLSCYSGSCTGYNASFVYNSTTSIASNSYSTISVNITFNSSMPKNTVYSGWIYINATNATSNLTAHPYSGFTITLRLNLTDLLDIRLVSMSSDWTNSVMENVSRAENITIRADVYYINGSGPITDFANLSNFTSVWLQERNVTGTIGRLPRTGNLSFYNGSNPLYCPASCPPWGGDNHYYVNATIPADQIGGGYDVHVTASYSRDSFTYAGEGSNGTISINNTGLYMSAMNSTSISLSNSSSTTFYINVSNYGASAASSATIQFSSSSCTGYSVVYGGATAACSVGSTGTTVTISPPAYNTSCAVWWTITAGTSTASACTGNIIGDSTTNKWFDRYGVNVSVAVTGGTTSTTIPSSSSTPAEPTYVANLNFTKADNFISIQQNSSNSTTVEVKNIGNKSQAINFSITFINTSWFTLNSTAASLAVGKSAGFLVTFNIGMVTVGDYTGEYKVNSSDKTAVSAFTLRVLPALETQSAINATLAAYRQNMTDLWKQINQSKAAGLNVTVAEEKLMDLKSTIEQAENYIGQGNYFNANQLLDSIKLLIESIKLELNNLKPSTQGGLFGFQLPSWLIYVFIGVAIVSGGLLVFLFWPMKGGQKIIIKPEVKKETPKIQVKMQESWAKIKERWVKIRRK